MTHLLPDGYVARPATSRIPLSMCSAALQFTPLSAGRQAYVPQTE